jgi:hypothetical protein
MSTAANTPGLDATLPDVSLILGGVERHLAFDFNAIVLAEKATGVNLLKAIVGDIDATKIRGLLWASLLRENPKLTLDEVGSWIKPRNVATIHQALIAAWFGSIDEPDAEDAAAGKGEAQTTPAV